jgi:glucan phosphorylase
MFIFGERVEGVDKCRQKMHEGDRSSISPDLKKVYDTVKSDFFGDNSMIHGIIDSL